MSRKMNELFAPESQFPTTHWSRVARAVDPSAADARAALAELCGAYWYPIYAFIRRKGHDTDQALDLTQEYFVRLLEKGVLAAADPSKGRLRAFLRTDCGFYLADARDRRDRLKRGGAVAFLSIDAAGAEGRCRLEPAGTLTPELLFDRAWAVALLEQAMSRLAAEYAGSGRADLFERLEPTLTRGPRAEPYATIAKLLGMTEAAVQQAASRLRKRYGALLREEVVATLDGPDEAAVEGEISDLFTALGR
jgi:DNA-directed RNA polymerase specialized sigma24 family protein